MNSEQIKQTVAEIREAEKNAFYTETGGNQFMNARSAAVTLLEITGHLQKTIEEKDDAIRRQINGANFLSNEVSEWRATAEAQAAEIERLKKRIKDVDPEREP